MQEKQTDINNGIINRRLPASTYRNRRLGVAAVGVVTALAAVKGLNAYNNHVADQRIDAKISNPAAVAEYKAGNIDPDKVVLVTATETQRTWDQAQELNPTGDVREVSDVIGAQVGPDGVQNGEQFLVDKNDVAPTPPNEQVASGQ
jgi:hypothetical protein